MLQVLLEPNHFKHRVKDSIQLERKQNKVITKRACFWVSCVYRLYLVKFGLNRSDCQRRTNDRDQMSSLLLLLFVIKLIRYCSLQIYPSGRVSCNWLSLRLVSLLFSLLIITPSYSCGHRFNNFIIEIKIRVIESDVVTFWYTKILDEYWRYYKKYFLCA